MLPFATVGLKDLLDLFLKFLGSSESVQSREIRVGPTRRHFLCVLDEPFRSAEGREESLLLAHILRRLWGDVCLLLTGEGQQGQQANERDRWMRFSRLSLLGGPKHQGESTTVGCGHGIHLACIPLSAAESVAEGDWAPGQASEERVPISVGFARDCAERVRAGSLEGPKQRGRSGLVRSVTVSTLFKARSIGSSRQKGNEDE